MNYLGIDYGTKRIGMAVSVSGVISPLPVLSNDNLFFSQLLRLIKDYSISKIYVGISDGKIALKTKKFVKELFSVVECEVETVEEAVSTIEADQIFRSNRHHAKDYRRSIDSVAAAVILRRVIN